MTPGGEGSKTLESHLIMCYPLGLALLGSWGCVTSPHNIVPLLYPGLREILNPHSTSFAVREKELLGQGLWACVWDRVVG